MILVQKQKALDSLSNHLEHGTIPKSLQINHRLAEEDPAVDEVRNAFNTAIKDYQLQQLRHLVTALQIRVTTLEKEIADIPATFAQKAFNFTHQALTRLSKLEKHTTTTDLQLQLTTEVNHIAQDFVDQLQADRIEVAFDQTAKDLKTQDRAKAKEAATDSIMVDVNHKLIGALVDEKIRAALSKAKNGQQGNAKVPRTATPGKKVNAPTAPTTSMTTKKKKNKPSSSTSAPTASKNQGKESKAGNNVGTAKKPGNSDKPATAGGSKPKRN